jgi:HlyD family secretion protein
VQPAEDAVKVPVSALFPVSGKIAVYVVEQGRAQHREVDLVARNGVEGWVNMGLDPGAKVIIYPPTSLKSSMQVIERK